ncbi:MAG: tetratricopeptide repeat protein [Kofleriaceae bacterium]|jgi:tetratricopeptide (TPR) repeat protein|nr:tetratricopeptide repeat protein [Kofleriaceae bacterium]MBP9168188.1 tetratricopeptide repeat protein [Kofleriaceae bacterium]MBP9856434.1 tetratricopeptide repeat protein [Kofleriaceae bacterium]
MSGDATHDVFVCHASVDKARLVEPLVAALVERCRLSVWLDRFEIAPGDAIGAAIDRGLVGARFAVVVVSPQFWTDWTAQELGGLYALEARDAAGRSRLIPVWAGVNEVDVETKSPRLAARRAIKAEAGIDNVARQIADHARAVAPRPLGRSPSYGVPKRRAQAFVGRELDVATLEAALAPGGRVSVAAAIEGLAGVGKTELALQVADRLSQTSRFPGGIYWLEAEQPELTPLWGGNIADQLEVAAGPIDERARAVLRRVISEGPALVVLDNVSAWTGATMPHPLPESPQVALLVTTRHRNLGGASFQHVPIECLAPKAASELLAVTSGRSLEDEAGAEELLGYLGGHTLAIELAGAFLREVPEVSAAAHLERLRAGDAVEEAATDFVPYERTVAQAFDATCERLDDEARHGLRVAACFADSEASLALLDACGVGERARARLRRFHLIAGTGDRWSMHRLVRAYGRRAGSEEAQAAAREAFIAGCVELVSAADLLSAPLAFRDREHMLAAVALQRVNVDCRLAALLAGVGVVAQSAGAFNLAKSLHVEALAVTRDVLPAGHPGIAARESNLGLCLKELGELREARALLVSSIKAGLAAAVYDGDAMFTRLNNLGMVEHALGDLSSARASLEQACAMAARPLGAAVCRGNLGLVLLDVVDFDAARDALQAAHDAHVSLRTGGRAIGVAKINLSAALRALGRLDAAREVCDDAMALLAESLGVHHLDYAKACALQGLVLMDSDRPQDAEPLFRRVLETHLNVFGESSMMTAQAHENLARALHGNKHCHEANEEFEKALAGWRLLENSRHPELTRTLVNHALVLVDLGDLARARTALEAAEPGDTSPTGIQRHDLVAHRRWTLAHVLWMQGHHDLARTERAAALAAARALPDKHYLRQRIEQAMVVRSR